MTGWCSTAVLMSQLLLARVEEGGAAPAWQPAVQDNDIHGGSNVVVLHPQRPFNKSQWSTVGAWSGEGFGKEPLDTKLAVFTGAAFATFDASFSFSVGSGSQTTAALIFGAKSTEEYYAVDFPADGQQRRANNFWATVSRVNSSRTGPGCFRETLSMQRVPGVTSAIEVPHTARVALSADGDIRVWVDGRPLRAVGLREHGDAQLAARPALLGFASYLFPTPYFMNLTIAAQPLPAATAEWRALPPSRNATSVAYTTLRYLDVWGMSINSLVRSPAGDLVALSDNGRKPGVNGHNAIIRSTDQGHSWSKDNNSGLPWPNYLYNGASLVATSTGISSYFLGPLGRRHKDRVLGPPIWLGRASSQDPAGRWWQNMSIIQDNVSFADFEDGAKPHHLRLADVSQCAMVKLRDGTLLLAATSHNNWTSATFDGRDYYYGVSGPLGTMHGAATPLIGLSFVLRSSDHGRSFSSPISLDAGGSNATKHSGMMAPGSPLPALEVSLAETQTNGTILALVRPFASPWMWETWSRDSGKSWTPLTRGAFPMYAALAAMITTQSGVILIGGRFPALSIQASFGE
eukprot:COSAG01_NODE_8978_length_2600_cov_2.155787_2_plen_574_part_00